MRVALLLLTIACGTLALLFKDVLMVVAALVTAASALFWY